MKPFFVSHDPFNNGKGTTLEVTPLEVLMSVDGADELTGVSYIPSRSAVCVGGHVEVVGIDSLEQAVAWYAARLHSSGRLRGKPLGYILPCIQISYGSGLIQEWVESEIPVGAEALRFID